MPARNSVVAASRSLTLERVFDAPVDLVWRCWTEAEHMEKWSAPRGYTITHNEGDLRVGGKWRCCMMAPDGTALWLGGVYREILPHRRIVMTHAWDDETGRPGTETIVTVHFESLAKRTKVTLEQTGFDSDESRDGHRGGWGEALDILAEHLAGMPAADGEFTFSRTFDAPRERVWRAWSNADALAQWWGPKGTTMHVLKLDFRPGGMFHYTIAFRPGHEMYARFIYREIVAPERIAFVISFSDAEGGITRAPFPQLEGKWPLEVLNVVTFTEQDGKTTVALRARPINATAEERTMFAANAESMRGGFGGAFDKLVELLATR